MHLLCTAEHIQVVLEIFKIFYDSGGRKSLGAAVS